MLGSIFNLPYTVFGFIVAIISGGLKLTLNFSPFCFIINIKKFWWAVGHMKYARAMTIGQVVLLGSNLEDKDLEHELVHVEQNQRAPLVQPVLYLVEYLRKGYRNNKYEVEAYERAGNIYKK